MTPHDGDVERRGAYRMTPLDYDRLSIALAALLASHWRRHVGQGSAPSDQEGAGVGTGDRGHGVPGEPTP